MAPVASAVRSNPWRTVALILATVLGILVSVMAGGDVPTVRTAKEEAPQIGEHKKEDQLARQLAAERAETQQRREARSRRTAQVAAERSREEMRERCQTEGGAVDEDDQWTQTMSDQQQREATHVCYNSAAILFAWNDGDDGTLRRARITAYRIARFVAPSPPSGSTFSGGTSSGSTGNDGYTGPRCYAPGGQTYTPC